jgi:hypothetical protein
MSDIEERRKVKRIDVFDHDILDAKVEHSLMVEITNEGAGLLILKEHSFFHEDDNKKCDIVASNVHLTIFHPDIPLDQGASVEATVIWVDHEYSDDRCKIGVCFADLDDVQIAYVAKLEEWLSKESNYYFHCELQRH